MPQGFFEFATNCFDIGLTPFPFWTMLKTAMLSGAGFPYGGIDGAWWHQVVSSPPAVKAKIMWRPQSLYSSRTAQQPIKRACYVTFVRFLVFSNTLSVIIFFWSYSGPIKLKLPKETALIGTFLECVQKYPPRPTIMMILDVCTLPDRVQVFPI